MKIKKERKKDISKCNHLAGLRNCNSSEESNHKHIDKCVTLKSKLSSMETEAGKKANCDYNTHVIQTRQLSLTSTGKCFIFVFGLNQPSSLSPCTYFSFLQSLKLQTQALV